MGTSEWFMLGLTIVDSLDTLWLMNMKKEYKEARDWVESDLSFGRRVPVNLFETTVGWIQLSPRGFFNSNMDSNHSLEISENPIRNQKSRTPKPEIPFEK